jgi:leukotriene-A4 hydrolase
LWHIANNEKAEILVYPTIFGASFSIKTMKTPFNISILLGLILISCQNKSNHAQEPLEDKNKSSLMILATDHHSFSKPNEVVITHMHLDLEVLFDKHILKGSVTLDVDNKTGSNQLHLDASGLKIGKVVLGNGDKTTYTLSEPVEFLGQDLAIAIGSTTEKVTIFYETSDSAQALLWMKAPETAGKKHPFMFSQSQAILARTWIPCQDSPGIKFTYSAVIKTDPALLALMSAENPTEKNEDGVYTFKMVQPVSSYLMALTVGDVEFKSVGRNSGVYAEPSMLDDCVWEFADMQSMIDSAEELYGEYVWGRYDLIVLPPSFPFGGMENPRLTFATPTIIAGDRSLVALVAHELAHSWSGNLVTNETWNDFWLNEGFTVYFEQRIMEKIYGMKYSRMQTKLGMGELKHTIARLEAENKSDDTHLYLELENRNPDDGMTDIAYEKGRFFLQTVEGAVGRENFDIFLKNYFSTNAFKPMNTERFIAYLDEHLFKGDSALKAQIDLQAWIYGPGLPPNCPDPQSEELDRVEKEVTAFNSGTKSASELDTNNWTTHHWLYFFRILDHGISVSQLSDLDNVYHFTDSKNSEILCDWFQHCIRHDYKTAYPNMKDFLTRVGRRKFLTPLYTPLSKTDDGKAWAKDVFEIARSGYHSVSENSIAEILE